MDFIESIKMVGKTLQEINRLDLYSQMLEVQRQGLDLVQQNHDLLNRLRDAKTENENLRNQKNIASDLVMNRDSYWRRLTPDKFDGPFCSGCWDSKFMLIRLHVTNAYVNTCPVCKVQSKYSVPPKSVETAPE